MKQLQVSKIAPSCFSASACIGASLVVQLFKVLLSLMSGELPALRHKKHLQRHAPALQQVLELLLQGAPIGWHTAGNAASAQKFGAHWQRHGVMQAKRFHPFGQGIRNCVGQQLARMNVPTAVAMFVGNFHLQVAPQVCILGWLLCALSVKIQSLKACFEKDAIVTAFAILNGDGPRSER